MRVEEGQVYLRDEAQRGGIGRPHQRRASERSGCEAGQDGASFHDSSSPQFCTRTKPQRSAAAKVA